MVELEHHRNGMDSGMEFDLKSSVRSAKGRQENKKKQLLKQTLEREDNQVTDRNRFMEENQNFNDGSAEKSYTKRKEELLKAFESLEEQKDDKRGHPEERNTNGERAKRRKTLRNTKLSKEPDESVKEQDIDGENNLEVANPKFIEDNGINEMEDKLPKDVDEGEETVVDAVHPLEENIPVSKDRKSDIRKLKMKKRLLEEAAKADQRGVCYLSRIPPHMDHVKLRQILSQYGEIQRIYLAPEGFASEVPRKRANRKRDGGFQEQGFSEGWVEFTKKSVAKRIANMLNGEQIGGRKRSSFYYDLWNIKYLSKFKWDDLTAEKAYKSAVREQKLALEMSAAKKERDFYLSKVDKSRALSAIEERLKKKQKVQQESGTNSDVPISQQPLKVVRQFSQKRPVAGTAVEKKASLSKDILAGVFGGS